ncbi:permease-like cell division protein FtsX [Desulfofalx alkaliphila]|uniref:permease-like cell division protein FtsX n=1 Tax=Desulfofalx alkaliphila TaxID=105483 RepID=UPI0004E0F1C9|nr:permease-like cell division protein FtsX [Desulfofalx alkaliphila]
MRTNTLFYIFREALVSMVRNSWMTLASMAIVAVSLIILGSSVLLVINADHLTQRLESELEISVFLQEDLDTTEAGEVGRQIKNTAGVAEVVFVSKEQALEEMKESFGNHSELLENLEKNPLPDAYRIRVNDANQVPVLAGHFEKLPGVELVRYGQGLVERLLAVTHWVRVITLGLMGMLGIAAIFLIATTIRMSLFARRREIGIMKLLGATNWYIRAPFMIEGMFIGLIGALVAVAAVYSAYSFLVNRLTDSIPFVSLVTGGDVLNTIFGLFIGSGVLIGALGSVISIRKFLAEKK